MTYHPHLCIVYFITFPIQIYFWKILQKSWDSVDPPHPGTKSQGFPKIDYWGLPLNIINFPYLSVTVFPHIKLTLEKPRLLKKYWHPCKLYWVPAPKTESCGTLAKNMTNPVVNMGRGDNGWGITHRCTFDINPPDPPPTQGFCQLRPSPGPHYPMLACHSYISNIFVSSMTATRSNFCNTIYW